MWLLYAVGSSFFAGITSILAKCGIKKTDSDVATAIRTIVVLLFSWLMVLITGTGGQTTQISGKTFLFLVLSGLATGASWLCYFHALQKGDINKVVPIDKSSTVLTILLALIFLHEGITVPKIISVVLIGAGTLLMIDKKQDSKAQATGKEWMIYAVLSAVFASLTAILGKVGIEGVDSNLGTGNPYNGCARYGLANGHGQRKMAADKDGRKKGICLRDAIGTGNRRVVAVLLPRTPDRTGKCCCTD